VNKSDVWQPWQRVKLPPKLLHTEIRHKQAATTGGGGSAHNRINEDGRWDCRCRRRNCSTHCMCMGREEGDLAVRGVAALWSMCSCRHEFDQIHAPERHDLYAYLKILRHLSA
jgi:hypothetical protein